MKNPTKAIFPKIKMMLPMTLQVYRGRVESIDSKFNTQNNDVQKRGKKHTRYSQCIFF